MWQRFTERARRVIMLGQEEAGRMNSSHLDTEHLLLGLIRENEGVGAQLLLKMGISLEQVRLNIEGEINQTNEPVSGEPKLTPRAKRVLELSAEEALLMHPKYIRKEHLLLALIREKDGTAGKVLRKLGLNLENVRQEVMAYLGPDDLGPDDWAPESTPETPNRAKGRKSETKNIEWMLPMLTRLLPHELCAMEKELRAANLKKESAILQDDYESAAVLRNKANDIELRIEEFVDKWEAATQESAVPTPDFMAEAVTNLIIQIEIALNVLQNNDTTRLDEVKANLGKLKAQLETKESEN